MNLDHLGDALDCWKGVVSARVAPLLHDLRVIPMRTGGRWSDEHLRLYAGLLGVTLEQVLFRDTLVEHRNRKEYFDPINFPEGSDLFLDPDTGVEPKSGPKKCHVGLNDLSKLLPDKSRRLIMVYQHRPRMDDSVQAVLDRIGQRRWIACAYWAGTVSMLFLSKQQDRIAGVYNTLAEWLGPCNEGEDGCPRRLFSKGMAE